MRIKCDSLSPACQRCLDHRLEYTGYEKQLEFVFFDRKSRQKNSSPSLRVQPTNTKQKGQPKLENVSDSVTQLAANRRRRPPPTKMSHMMELELDHSLGVPQDKMSFMALLQGRYIPEYLVPSNELGYEICSSWMLKACLLAANQFVAGHVIDSSR